MVSEWVSEWRSNKVATKPCLAFQAKAMVKSVNITEWCQSLSCSALVSWGVRWGGGRPVRCLWAGPGDTAGFWGEYFFCFIKVSSDKNIWLPSNWGRLLQQQVVPAKLYTILPRYCCHMNHWCLLYEIQKCVKDIRVEEVLLKICCISSATESVLMKVPLKYIILDF